MTRGTIRISIYQPPVAVLPQAGEPRYLKERSRWLTSLVAGAATLALHLIFITSIEWGLGSGRRTDSEHVLPRLSSPGADREADNLTMEWVEITESTSDEDFGETGFRLPELALQPVMVEAPSVPLLSDLGLEAAAQAAASGPPEFESAALSRLYLGQIDARIERAWLRPRSHIGSRAFSCKARIDQDEQGNVHDIALIRCNGSARWQQSLVQAIRAASPLPAPPDPHIFKRIITMHFQAQPYSATDNPDLYEPGTLRDELTQ
jgi:hypothetical protein